MATIPAPALGLRLLCVCLAIFCGATATRGAGGDYGRGALLILTEQDGAPGVDIRLWKDADARVAETAHGRLCIAVDSNAPCFLLVAPFDDATNSFPPNWKPFGNLMGSWKPQYVPEIHPGGNWSVPKNTRTIEIFVALIHPDDPDLPALRQSLQVINNEQTSRSMRNQQAAKLHTRILGWVADNDSSSRRVVQEQWNAGVKRSVGYLADMLDEFGWRDDARTKSTALFSKSHPGILIFRANIPAPAPAAPSPKPMKR